MKALRLFVALMCLGGCATEGGDDDQATASNVTYYRDVLPLVQSRCLPCHAAGGAAGIPFDDPGVAQAYSPLMAARTADGYMPPWPPDPVKTEFLGEETRVLTGAEKQLFADWTATGAPLGDPADAPPVPTPTPDLLGAPTLAVASPAYVFDDTTVQDEIACFEVDPMLTTTSDVITASITPGNKDIVHHVIVFQKIAAGGGGDGSGGGGGGDGGGSGCFGAMLFGWVPGSEPAVLPEGYGLRLKPGDKLVLQIHYNANENGVPDEDPGTSADLWFSQAPVEKVAHVAALGSPFINIPPHTTGVEVTASCKITPEMGSVELLSTGPHMHTHATKFQTRIESPQNGNDYVVDIPRWDFNWQGSYQFRTPLLLEPGDELITTCTYDNNDDFSVQFGEGTDDEMCFNFLLVYGDMPVICL